MEQAKKKIILVVILCATVLVLIAGSIWLWIFLSQFSSYHNRQYGFNLSYPVKWEKTDDYKGIAVAFIRPKQTALDTFQPNINITVQNVPAHIATLSSFSETITKQMTAVFEKNMKILEDKNCKFAKRPGHRLVVAETDSSHLKIIFVWTIKGSEAYVFTFMAEDKQYDELFPIIKRMIDTFELK